MSYLKDFQTQIARHDYSAILQLWEEYCNADELDCKELCEILEAMKKSDLAAQFGRHADRILPLWEQVTDEQGANDKIKQILDIQVTNTEQFATLAYDSLQKRFGSDKNFQDKIRLVGLRNREKFQGAISNFELLSHMAKNNFVFHQGGWGVGQILDVSLLREQLCVEFENIAGKRDLSFATAFKSLIPISNDHILALRFGDPDLLEKRCRENPVEVIKQMLIDLGPKTASEIKDELCDLVIPQDAWSKWWQLARVKIKKDPMIENPEEVKDKFRLRTQEFTSDERLKKMLDGAIGTDETIQAVYTFFRDFPESSKNEELKTFAIGKLSNLLTDDDISDAQELEILFLLQELGSSKEKNLLQELVQRHESILSILSEINILAFKKKFLQEIRKVREDWASLFEHLLLTVDYNPLRDYILSELGDGSHLPRLQKVVIQVVSHPEKTPDAFLWYFQKAIHSETLPYCDKEGKSRLFESLLILLSHVETDPSQKSMVKKIHSLISQDRYAIVRQTMQDSSIEEVKEFLLLATKCHSLGDHEVKIFHSLAEVVYPSLIKPQDKKLSSMEENVIWCTQEGYSKMQKRVQHIATVETVENAKEIEVARGHGDLRENAEFKAALERRDRLQSELKMLSEQLGRARILTQDDVSSSEVSVGAEVECKTEDGKKLSYVLLGPWEANPDKNILSFQSKLAQTMQGLRVGDSFKFQDEEYTITGIRNHFSQ